MSKLKVQSDAKSFTMVKNAIIDSVDVLNEHEKILYIVLLRYGNKAFPSLTTLSKQCGFSKRTAQRTIGSLITKGLLKKKNRINDKKGNTSNIYTLIDNDKIWKSSKENLKENLSTAILEEAVKIVESSGMKILGKEKVLESTEPTKVTAESNTNQLNQFDIANTTTNSDENQDLERYTLDQIKQLFDYDIMLADHPGRQPDIDSAIDVLYTAMNTSKPTIRIFGTDMPVIAVTRKLMRLNNESIMYAIEKFSEQTDRIKNPTAYLLAVLYRAPEQYHLDTKNQFSHDMALPECDTNKKGLQMYNSYSQRTYDYEALEKELLSRP